MAVKHIMTFSEMRKDHIRDWLRLSDLQDAAAAAGRWMTRYEVRRAIRHLPKPAVKRYGHWHYTDEHRDAVVAAAKSMVEVVA
jgi:hypothetical protein